MTAWTWLALSAALVLVPLGNPVSERLHSLRRRGRLLSPGSHARRGERPQFRPTTASAAVFGAATMLLVTVRAGPILGLAAGLVATVVAQLVTGALRRRAGERSAAELLAALRLVVAEVTAGASAEAALRAAAELDTSRATTYRAAADALREGGDAGAVLAADRELRGFGSAWTVAAVTGAPVAAVLERVAADVSARREHDAAVSAALAGPRSSAAVLAALPVLGILLGLGMDADPLGFLLGNPAGQLVCLAGVGLDVAGLLWTRRLAGAALR
jgi:tight adherence protein B